MILKSIWNFITGRKLPQDIVMSDELINKWLDIYHGKSDWIKYSYPSLTGRKIERRRKSLNAAKLICSELSRLVWSEMPEMNIDDDIEKFLEENNFGNKMVQFTEYGAAGGGYALKLYSKDMKLKLDYVPANMFIPVTWDNKRIVEADFISREIINEKSYLKKEKHRKTETGYIIDVEIYDDSSEGSYKRVQSLEPESVEITVSRPLFVYISNPEANNLSLFSPLGISLYANAVDTLEALDIAFDALVQEIVLGRKRIIVPASATRLFVDTETGKRVRYFDPSDEIFQAFNPEDAQNIKITDNTVELRIEELRLAVQTLFDVLATQTGFSAGTFSFDGVSMKTATEVISENSKTFKLKQSFENQIKSGVLGLLETIREIGGLYGINTSTEEYTMVFNDAVIEDRNSKTSYWLQRYAQGTATLKTVLEELDGMTEEEAEEEAQKIKEQNQTIDTGFVGI